MHVPQVTSAANAATGEMGQEYLATGKQVAMRRWQEEAGKHSQPTIREYETVGYVVKGTLEFDLDGEIATLRAGDSWLVPAGATHRYRVTESLMAVEATSPPARFNDRDEPA